ncbi:hypothetical protein FSP39_000318 [Pinctada imbricata]|uniref:Uncharacterized protein n=1 Tax=Pinctada imbricata TaxID=66713 RepID=A0AA88YKQ8_PINIB|nr:hypothetical protein FSP39_000318 [Pinctada imbricata]
MSCPWNGAGIYKPDRTLFGVHTIVFSRFLASGSLDLTLHAQDLINVQVINGDVSCDRIMVLSNVNVYIGKNTNCKRVMVAWTAQAIVPIVPLPCGARKKVPREGFDKRQYPEIKHSNDVWHAAKNLGKKINAAGQEKTCKDLQQWNQDIVNHFWHCCKTANTFEEFLVCWNSCFCTTLYISVDTYLF